MRKYEKSLPTAEAVAAKIEEIEREELLPKGMKIRVFNQRTDLVHVTTHNVLHNLVVGMVLVVAVLFVFLGDLTSAGDRGPGRSRWRCCSRSRCSISRGSRPTCCRSARWTSGSSSTAR